MNPVAFTIFGLEVRWYGILIALGAVLAILFAEELIKRNPRLPDEAVIDMSIAVLPIGIIGARLYYVLFEWEYYSQNTSEIFAIRNGGLAIHGGIIAGIIVIAIFCKVRKWNLLDVLDMVACGVPLAQGIGRWGNFMNGEAHGGPTDLPWAIPVGGEMVHPTFLYESILDVGIFLFIYFYLSKKREFPGELTAFYFIVYSIGRFFIEGLRTDSLYIGPLRIAQVVSLIGIFVGVMILIFGKKQKNGADYRLLPRQK
ncbi:MAG: prolipoprotein diacylglyceryl transferase [Peptoniphilus sp.]|nr:prolipoprotein diacylglyceryl transferase [Peptoniphilus sp.]MDD7363127.1 prolipoprotein diacylglyceryl transferase [Bacillota bacterium]MDY6044351.1 prolipoprotein diacylglyceryl transferase [Peptoniphilus sp.]